MVKEEHHTTAESSGSTITWPRTHLYHELNSFGRIRGCDSADAAWWLARTTAAGTRVVAAGTGSSARRTGRMLPLLSESISQAHFNPQDWDGLISQAHFNPQD